MEDALLRQVQTIPPEFGLWNNVLFNRIDMTDRIRTMLLLCILSANTTMSKTLSCIAIPLLCVGLVGFVAAEDNSDELPPPATPLLRAHAHNDFYHPRPLFDALDNGFGSVEADIFLVNGELLVAHFIYQIRPERTLESLYLAPLRERARRFDGKIFPDADEFYLWIDFKTEPQATYAVLRPLLEKYSDILTRYENGTIIPGAVTVVLTGSANLGLIRNESVRFAGVDGGLASLDSDVPAHLIPAAGINWRQQFPQFTGELSPAEREKLAEQVRKANERGRKLRYWNAPDHEEFWNILYDAGVHLINTGRLQPLRDFLLERSVADP